MCKLSHSLLHRCRISKSRSHHICPWFTLSGQMTACPGACACRGVSRMEGYVEVSHVCPCGGVTCVSTWRCHKARSMQVCVCVCARARACACAVAFILSVILCIYTFGLRDKWEGECDSAYSVFNPGARAIPGGVVCMCVGGGGDVGVGWVSGWVSID